MFFPQDFKKSFSEVDKASEEATDEDTSNFFIL